MATKAKTKASCDAERKSSHSQTSSKRSQTESVGINAFDLVEQDHRQIEEWLDEFDEMKEGDKRKGELAEKICVALKVHSQIEEEIFYPQARDATKDDDLIDEAIVEHGTVKNLIGEIEKMKVDDELYDAKVRVLGEMVKRHIREEEEEIFSKLQSTKMEIDAVGKELAERKEALMEKMHA
jgi:hemerythrin superfamily protein